MTRVVMIISLSLSSTILVEGLLYSHPSIFNLLIKSRFTWVAVPAGTDHIILLCHGFCKLIKHSATPNVTVVHVTLHCPNLCCFSLT